MGYDERLATVIILEASRGGKRAIGSGVIVSTSGEQLTYYVVTAAHVAANPKGRTFVRMTSFGGEIVDIPIEHWFYNTDSHEVAVSRLPLSPGDYEYRSVPFHLPERYPELDLESLRFDSRNWAGSEVLFIGAYPQIEAMVEQNRPMIRSGLMGVTWQNRVEVHDRRKQLTLHHTVHLIDCYAHSGFSGAPCYDRTASTDALSTVAARRRTLSANVCETRHPP